MSKRMDKRQRESDPMWLRKQHNKAIVEANLAAPKPERQPYVRTMGDSNRLKSATHLSGFNGTRQASGMGQGSVSRGKFTPYTPSQLANRAERKMRDDAKIEAASKRLTRRAD